MSLSYDDDFTYTVITKERQEEIENNIKEKEFKRLEESQNSLIFMETICNKLEDALNGIVEFGPTESARFNDLIVKIGNLSVDHKKLLQKTKGW